MKIITDKRICVKCKIEKNIFTDFGIEFLENYESSYVRRVCKICAPQAPLADLEAKFIKKILNKLVKKKLTLENAMEVINEEINDHIAQLNHLKKFTPDDQLK